MEEEKQRGGHSSPPALNYPPTLYAPLYACGPLWLCQPPGQMPALCQFHLPNRI